MTAEIIWHVDFRAKGNGHTSTCATSNGPALPVGECDCGGLGPIEQMPDKSIKQINPFEKPDNIA